MAKSNDQATATSATSPPAPPPGPAANAGTRMVTICYSRSSDLYRVPAMDKPCWLSVMAYDLPVADLPADAIYLGPAMTASGLHWRKAYSTTWRAILPGSIATVPADDPLVLDYAAAKGK